MSLLTVANLRVTYGTHVVLDGATVAIDPGEKVGLVGRNGSGKTSLMKALLGEIEPDGGSVQFQRGARVGYLSQDPRFDPEETVRDTAEGAFAELHDLHQQANALYEQMATAEGDDLDKLLKQQAKIDAAIEAGGGYAVDHKIDAMLHGLGFDDGQFSQKTSTLSGGQRNRLGLVRLLLEAPDLLMLDEPTNHLDIDGRQWLETFLRDEYAGAVLVVSHDRWLLDKVVTRIVEVERGVIREYPGNYHKYVDLRRERMLTESRVYEKQMDKIRQEQQFIRKFKTGQRAKEARGRQTRLDRYKRDELVDKPMELDVMRLKLPKASRSGDMVISASGIAKSYDDLQLFTDFDLTVQRGERIGIIGPNGTGKTTLVKCLLDEVEPDAGEVRLGSRLSIGYYKQTHEHLDMSLTIWQYLQRVIVSLDGEAKASEQQARDLAGAFLFSGAEQDKTLQAVSGGERSRAVLAGLVAGAHNLLLLDEPSNHLDIPSAERLEQALSTEGGYEGTLLLISHDRALLDATCEKLVIFDGEGNVRVFQGTYSEWLARQSREIDEARAAAAALSASNSQPQPSRPKRPPKPEARGPFAGWSMTKLEGRIEEIEARVAEIDSLMGEESVYTDGQRVRELQRERTALVDERGPLEDEWSNRAETA